MPKSSMPNDCMPKDIMPKDCMPNDFMPFYCPAQKAIVLYTVIDCDNYCQITVAHVTQPMTVNWL